MSEFIFLRRRAVSRGSMALQSIMIQTITKPSHQAHIFGERAEQIGRRDDFGGWCLLPDHSSVAGDAFEVDRFDDAISIATIFCMVCDDLSGMTD